MANPTSVEEAIKVAPVGAQWYRPGSPDGKRIAQNLRKTKDGLVIFGSGQATYKVTAAEAAAFFKGQGLTDCNMPQFMPKPKPKTPAKKKTPPVTKGAPKKKPVEAPKKEKDEDVDKQFDSSDIQTARAMQTALDAANFGGLVQDWRVRLELAPGAKYLYAGSNPGILQPLRATNGVIFPYTPAITVAYSANYEPVTITHSNYKVFQYSSSSVDQVTISADFTCQDVYEARYLLAVIHFFKSMTKMFYGQDQYPIRGTPPPLCYMFGMGGYQFSAHPLAISGFTYTLPQDVDYIQTTAPSIPEESIGDNYLTSGPDTNQSATRLGSDFVTAGGLPPPPNFNNTPSDITTWVPTKIQLAISCYPVMSRNQTSNYFSLADYASGHLIKGQSRPGGGMW